MNRLIAQIILIASLLVLLSTCSNNSSNIGDNTWIGTKQRGVPGKSSEPGGVAVDSKGNVYVGGTEYVGGVIYFAGGGGVVGQPVGSLDTKSFITIYDPGGNMVRTQQSNVFAQSTIVNGIAVDSIGNVYVTGDTDPSGYDFYLMYDSLGNMLRTQQIIGLGLPTGVAVDSNGNVNVVGTISIPAAGPAGEVIEYFYAIIMRLDSLGNTVFSQQLGASGSHTYATGVAVDSGGNEYMAGYTDSGLDGNTLTGTTDFYVTMCDSLGNIVRTNQLGVIGQSTGANGVAVDSSGNVYVAGWTTGGLDGNTLTGTTDFFVTTYDSSGNKVRTKQLGVSGQGTGATSVAVDSSGNVHVAGCTTGGLDGNTLTGTMDFFVTTYDSSGNKVWTKQLGASGQLTCATGVAVDSNGNVYVAGYTEGGLEGNVLTGTIDMFVAKYDSLGNKQ